MQGEIKTTREQKWQTRFGSSLGPMALTTAIAYADQGFMRMISDVLDEVRETDSHLHGILQKRELRVASADISVKPSRSRRTTAKARKVAEFCEEALLGIGGFRQLVAHLMNGNYMNRSVAELKWKRNGKYILPTGWYFIHSRRVSFDDNFDPIMLDEDGGQFRWPGKKIEEFAPGKLILFCPTVRHVYPTREGLGRIVMWTSAFKRWGVRDWLALAELAAKPGRVGYYGTGKKMDTSSEGKWKLPEATKEHVNTLRSALRSYSTTVDIALPDSVMLDLIFAPSGVDRVHQDLINWCNSEMSKAVTGETLTTDAGSRGARSLGEVHQNEATMISRWDSQQLAEVIRTNILAPIVYRNFGFDYPVPFVHFDVDPEGSLDLEATRVEKLVKSGLRLSADELRQRFRYSNPSNDEEVIGERVQNKEDRSAAKPELPTQSSDLG